MKLRLEIGSQKRNEREDEFEEVKALMASEKQRDMADLAKKYEDGAVVPS